ncbi:hypothetical protein M9H77_00103 [Catharanthus roseus]|nr:hypothetical protein M9H77_00103 [Catharanthus roseus]
MDESQNMRNSTDNDKGKGKMADALSPEEIKYGRSYETMIFEAIGILNAPTGSDIDAIVAFVERIYWPSPKLRSYLSSKLEELVAEDKLEKVENAFKIRTDTMGSRNPVSQGSGSSTPTEAVENAAKRAADMIVEAEKRSQITAEAVREVEWVASLVDEMEVALSVLKEMKDSCLKGEIYIVPEVLGEEKRVGAGEAWLHML